MLDALGNMAAELGMVFGYGTFQDLSDLADKHTEGVILFHNGYLLADLNQDAQGALEYRYKLVFSICLPSVLTDTPETRKQRLDQLDLYMRQVYKALTKQGQVSQARAELGLNVTSRNLDAINLSLTLLTNAVSLCQV